MNTVFDVASFSESLSDSYTYNGIIEMMEIAGILPFYESKSIEVYKGVGKAYGWTEELCIIFDAYVEKYGDQELTD